MKLRRYWTRRGKRLTELDDNADRVTGQGAVLARRM
jgi:hypothetical protein